MPDPLLLRSLRVILEAHEGREAAITADAIAERLGLATKDRDRKVRLMIEELIFNEGLAVVACGEGFFTPRTWVEGDEYKRQMRSRITEDCKRLAQTKKNIYNHFHGQKAVKMI